MKSTSGSYADIDRTPGVRLAGYRLDTAEVDWGAAVKSMLIRLATPQTHPRVLHPFYDVWLPPRVDWNYDTAVRNFNAMTAWKWRRQGLSK